MRRVSACVPAALCILAACGENVTVQQLRGKLATRETIDFGDVQVGMKLEYALELKNEGDGPLDITDTTLGENRTTSEYEFTIGTTKLTLGPNQTIPVVVTFQPFVETEDPVRWQFTFKPACAEGDAECAPHTVAVSGRGITSGLDVEPNPIEFGNVLIGSSRDTDVTITNALGIAVPVRTRIDAFGRAEIVNPGGLGRFEVVSEVDPTNGSLLGMKEKLEPMESIAVTVRYTPDPGREDVAERGTWRLSNCDSVLCEVGIEMRGKGTNGAIACTPDEIDFERVNPGTSVMEKARCKNDSSEAVTVTGWRLETGHPPEFTIERYAGNPSVLEPGGMFEIGVTFSPTQAGLGMMKSGAIEITGRNPRINRDLTPARIPIKGQVGGPDIEVSPAAVDFGQIAVNTTGKRRLLVENTGFSDLTVSMIEAGNAMIARFSVDRTMLVVPPGGAEVVEVTYSPNAVGVSMGEVVITSDDQEDRETRIPVRGEAIDLPPCAYTLQPENINFGIVEVLRSTSQGIRIQNAGTEACLLNDIEIAPGSAPDFRLAAGPETGIMLAPGATKRVIVEFTPASATARMGSLTFYVSDPRNSNPVVALSGVGATSALLISPNELDFGQVGVNCATRSRMVTVYNTGSAAATIARVELPASVTREFELMPPPNGSVIPPGDSLDFSVRYRAADEGQDAGVFHLYQAGQTTPYVVPMYGAGAHDTVNEDRFQQVETPKADILFVVDNSCSMEQEQAALTANFNAFVAFAEAQTIDYRLAVITTDTMANGGCANPPDRAQAQRPNNLDQGACGYFADGNRRQHDAAWRIISPDEQPSPIAAFSAIATQGTGGSGVERGLEAAYRALSSPLITGWNAGFVRPDAYLALIFISDEPDGSERPVDFYVNSFLAIKGFRNTALFSASAVVGPQTGMCNGPGGSAIDGSRYIDLANRTGGIVESICTADWAQALLNLGLSAFGYKSRFYLTNLAVDGTVRVFLDGVEQDPIGSMGQVRWTYDAPTNSVNFAPLAIPEPRTDILIRYVPQCL